MYRTTQTSHLVGIWKLKSCGDDTRPGHQSSSLGWDLGMLGNGGRVGMLGMVQVVQVESFQYWG